MTVYVVDETRPIPPTTKDNEPALLLQPNDTVILAEGSSISASGWGSPAIAGERNTLLFSGLVHSERDTAVVTSGHIEVSSTGFISGGADGIRFSTPGTEEHWFNFLDNAGRISAAGTAVLLDTSRGTHTSIVNSGSIVGGDGIYAYGYDAPDDTLTITNTGLIKGDTAILGLSMGSNVVINKGEIEGTVVLGSGGWIEPHGPPTNVYDGRGGILRGEVIFGAGNDIAYGGDGAETFDMGGNTNFVDGGGGIDTLLVSGTVDLRRTDKQETNSSTWNTIRNIENLVGRWLADHLIGNDADNRLVGNGNSDILDGQDGDDVLDGGTGNDALLGGDGTDVAVFSGNFSDYVIEKLANGSFSVRDTRAGHDGVDSLTDIEYVQFADRTIALTSTTNSAPTSISLDTTTVDVRARAGALVGHLNGVDPDGDPLGYFLAANPGGHFRIQGDQLLVDRTFDATDTDFDIVVRASDPKGASLDRHFTISVAHDGIVSLREGGIAEAEIAIPSLVVRGGKRADRLAGGAGDDRLDGRAGKDKLIGHDGNDAFVFSTKLGKGNVDRILDFTSGEDGIQLSAKIFKGLGRGTLSKDAFHVGAKAGDADDRIIYNAKTGVLSYDVDGSGTEHAAVKFAVLSHKPHLSAADLLVI